MSSFISSSGLTYLWTKIKAWVNGQGFLTQHQDISGKADKSATVSTVTYDTTNKKIRKTINGNTTDVVTAATIVTDGGGITTETDPTVPSWAKASSKPTYTASEVGALPDTTAIPTESTVSGWGFTKNAGTITGITMNGSSKGTSGVVNLGTVITAHQDISGKADKATTLAGYGITDAASSSDLDDYLPLSGGAVTGNLSVAGTSTLTGNITAGGHIYMGNAKHIYMKKTDNSNIILASLTTGNNIQIATNFQDTTGSITVYCGTGGILFKVGGATGSYNALVIDSTLKATFKSDVAIGGDLTIGGQTVVKVYSGSTAPSSSTGSDGDIYIQTS